MWGRRDRSEDRAVTDGVVWKGIRESGHSRWKER